MRMRHSSNTTHSNLTRGQRTIRVPRTTRVGGARSQTSVRRMSREAGRTRRGSLLPIHTNRTLTFLTRLHRLLILTTGSLHSLSTKRVLQRMNISINNHILSLTMNPTKRLTRSSHGGRSRQGGARRRRHRLVIRHRRNSRSTRSSGSILNRHSRRIHRRRQSDIHVIHRANSRLTSKGLIRLLIKRQLGINR